MALQGAAELKARLRATKLAFKPIGRDWADEYVKLARPRVPSRTGRLRQSFRRKSATQKRALVTGHFTAYFIDKGPKPHTIVAKNAPNLVFQAGGRTIFAKRVNHRGYRGRPFRVRTMNDAIKRTDMDGKLIEQWNKAA